MSALGEDRPLSAAADCDWHRGLGRAIAAIETPAFAPALVDALLRIVRFDHAVVFGYCGEERPVDVFDNFGPERRDVFVTLYQSGPYLLDPFFHACRARIPDGLYRLRQLAPDRFYQSEYYRSYYIRTGLTEEIGFFVATDGGVTAVLSLMRAGHSPAFSEREIRRLRAVEPVVTALGARSWRRLGERFDRRRGDPRMQPAVFGAAVRDAFRNFGRRVLTPRECEVVSLVLRGHSSDAIAGQLGIAPGTVKIHRKNIYSKLGITSQGELFSLFIASLAGPAKGADTVPPDDRPPLIGEAQRKTPGTMVPGAPTS